MSLDITKLDVIVLDDINQFTDGNAENMSVRGAFDAFLKWNGIIGYTDLIILAYESIKNAEVK